MSEQIVYAGTLESNDIYLTLRVNPDLPKVEITLQSIVLDQYGESIRTTLIQTLEQYGVQSGVAIEVNDKGALPCTIEARVKTVLARANLL